MEPIIRSSVLALLLCGVSFAAIVPVGQGSFRCDYTLFDEPRSWFKLHLTVKTWSEANLTCGLEGATLAIPTNDFIKDAMISLMFDFDMRDHSRPTLVHTGLHPTGDMLNSVELEDADTIGLTDDGVFRKVSPYTPLPFICYKHVDEVVELIECDTTETRDKDYIHDGRTGHCYRFHRNRATWENASKSCSDEGGYLAIINSDVEAEVIKDLFAKNPTDSIPGYVWQDSAFLGFCSDEDHFWHTEKEESLSEAGYARWSLGEPNNARGDENCGTVGRNGRLFDDPCDRELPYICEAETEDVCGVQEIQEQTTTTTAPKPDPETLRKLLEERAILYSVQGLPFDKANRP